MRALRVACLLTLGITTSVTAAAAIGACSAFSEDATPNDDDAGPGPTTDASTDALVSPLDGGPVLDSGPDAVVPMCNGSSANTFESNFDDAGTTFAQDWTPGSPGDTPACPVTSPTPFFEVVPDGNGRCLAFTCAGPVDEYSDIVAKPMVVIDDVIEIELEVRFDLGSEHTFAQVIGLLESSTNAISNLGLAVNPANHSVKFYDNRTPQTAPLAETQWAVGSPSSFHHIVIAVKRGAPGTTSAFAVTVDGTASTFDAMLTKNPMAQLQVGPFFPYAPGMVADECYRHIKFGSCSTK